MVLPIFIVVIPFGVKELDQSTKKSVSGQVFTQISAILKNGQIKPGEFLPSERELAIALEAGRPSVREALKKLEFMGVIEITHGKGAKVVLPTFESVVPSLISSVILTQSNALNMIEVREIIEPKSAFIAATRATAAQLQRIFEALTVMNQFVDNPNRFADADYQFHSLIVQAADNPVLSRFYDTVASMLRTLLLQTAEIPDRRKSFAIHQSIYKAIYNRLPEEAFKIMEFHIVDTRRRFVDYQTVEPGI